MALINLSAGRIILFFSILFVGHSYSAQYFLNAISGNDALARRDVTNKRPYKNWAALRPKLTGGDTVTIATGNYGSIIEAQTPVNVFPSLVTVQAAEGAQVRFQSIVFGRNGTAFVGADKKGSYEANVKFKGISVDDGVSISGGKNIQFENCVFQRFGPWTGSDDNIEKIAFFCQYASRISVLNCEVTKTGIGFCLSGSDMRLAGNDIHDITHDGIRCVGLSSSLFEGNHIHGLDDGVTDAEASWSRHSDGIHIFIAGSPTAEGIAPNSDLTFRGNAIYDIESLGVQFNNYYAFPEIVNTNIVFENNIFGPTGAIAFNAAGPVDGLLFRHNSFVTGLRTYTSPYTDSGRTISCSNSSLRISAGCSNVRVYNNILGTVLMETSNPKVFDYNMIQSPSGTYAYTRSTVIPSQNPYSNPASLSGILTANSVAVNAGTIVTGSPPYPYDRYGTARDAAPDMGAYEVPGLNPPPAPVAEEAPMGPLAYVDDFEDANLAADPSLNSLTQAGMAWNTAPLSTSSFTVTRRDAWRNCLSTPFAAGAESVILALPEVSWDQYSFTFSADNAYLTRGVGPVLFYQDPRNYFMLDIGRDAGNLIQRRNGVNTVVAGIPSVRMPHAGDRHYKITVARVNGIKTVYVDADNNGTKEISYIIQSGNVPFSEAGGGVGFFYSGYQNNLRMIFDNIILLNTAP